MILSRNNEGKVWGDQPTAMLVVHGYTSGSEV